MSDNTLTQWFCEGCGYVWEAVDPKCCGKIVEFDSKKHVFEVIAKSNGFIRFSETLKNHPEVIRLADELSKNNENADMTAAHQDARPNKTVLIDVLNEALNRLNEWTEFWEQWKNHWVFEEVINKLTENGSYDPIEVLNEILKRAMWYSK